MRNVLTDLLGTEYPLLQGGMASVSTAPLVAAVAKAGGVGIIASGNESVDWVREQVRAAKAATGGQGVFGVNIMLMSWHAADIAEMVVEEGVQVVTTGAGNPAQFVPAWLDVGIKVIPVIASTAHARMMEKSGAVAVVAEGMEAGGHIGELTTMTLVPQVVDVVDIPVLAAGGIADGRGIAASFMLGAVGVQVGTRFLASDECAIHQTYKDKVVAAKDRSTITTGQRLGHPVRSLKSPFSNEFYKKEYDMTVSNEELEKLGAGSLRRAATEGDEITGCFMAGQSAGLVRAQMPVAEIIEEMFSEAKALLDRAPGMLG